MEEGLLQKGREYKQKLEQRKERQSSKLDNQFTYRPDLRPKKAKRVGRVNLSSRTRDSPERRLDNNFDRPDKPVYQEPPAAINVAPVQPPPGYD